jgi:hypothetical protein
MTATVSTPITMAPVSHVYDEQTDDGSPDIVTVIASSVDGTYVATQTEGVTVTDAQPTLDVEGGSIAPPDEEFPIRIYPSDPSDLIDNYTVSWGDGASESSSETALQHVYAAVYGTIGDTVVEVNHPYLGTVTAYDSDGNAVASTNFSVDVGDEHDSGNIALNAPSSVREGDNFSLTATFTDPVTDADGPPSYIAWGDGTIDSAGSSKTFEHAYAEAGTYTITAGAYYNETYTGSAVYVEQPITVTEVTPALTVSGDTTATVTGDTYALSTTYTDTMGDHSPQNWTIAWGDGTSDYYYAGSDSDPVFTHIYTTASTSGQQYTPEVTVQAENYSGSITASTSVMIAQPVMQVIQSNGSPLDHHAEQTTGAFLPVNDSDLGGEYNSDGSEIADYSQTSNSYADPELVEVTFRSLPSEVGGNFELTWSAGDFTVWADANKDNNLATGVEFAASDGPIAPVYLEGLSITSQMAADALSLNWAAPFADGVVVHNVDHVNLTVLKVSGPHTVPSNGKYLYSIEGASPRSTDNSWYVYGGTNSGYTSPTGTVLTNKQIVTWSDSAFGTDGWDGTVAVTIGPADDDVYFATVAVVSVAVASPSDAFTTGTPSFYGNGNLGNRQTIVIGSGPSLASPGLKWNATVTLSGPNPNAYKAITVGFIQNATNFHDDGTYGNILQLHSNLDTALPHPVLDGLAGFAPWYNGPASFASRYFNVDALSGSDLPNDGPYTTSPKLPTLPLTAMALEYDFVLYVCAQAVDAPSFYAEEASAAWKFVGDGNINVNNPANPYTRANNAKVTAADEWNTDVAPGAEPLVTGIEFNDYLRVESFK